MGKKNRKKGGKRPVGKPLKNDEGKSENQEKGDSVASELQPSSESVRIVDEKIRTIEVEINSLKDKSKDVRARKFKLESDRQPLEKKLKQEEDNLKKAKDELNKLGDKFVYKSSEQGTERDDQGLGKMLSGKGGKKKEEKKSASFPSISLPKEDFPTIGTLYACNNERFLEIFHEEEIEKGKRQAEYFKAKLVVKESL